MSLFLLPFSLGEPSIRPTQERIENRLCITATSFENYTLQEWKPDDFICFIDRFVLERTFKNCILLISNLYFHFKEQWQIDGLSYIEHSIWKNSHVNITPKLGCFNRKTFVVCHLHWVWNLTWFWPVYENHAKKADIRVQIEIECWTIEHFCEKGKLAIAFCGWSLG